MCYTHITQQIECTLLFYPDFIIQYNKKLKASLTKRECTMKYKNIKTELQNVEIAQVCILQQ